MKSTFSLIIIILLNLELYSQIDKHVWVSEDGLSCIEFNSATGRMNIGDDLDNYLEGKIRYEYKLDSNTINILWYNNQRLFWYEKDKSMWTYQIEQDSVLSIHVDLDDSRGGITEMLGAKDIQLKKSESLNCNEFYKKNN